MSRPTLYYTFGNHMHWVDMEWLWGYHVLPGSVRDMIRICREADVKGCVNFDGIGYEKLAAEDPEALAELREAVQEGIVEPVGCSYGQPYGLFHGGESNVRQLIYGARAVRRLLGVWPKTFWEEEFYFFPQLPQMLAGCGFTGASLFFQWTWHTPEVPKEESPVIWWEGLDGTRILAATRNALNMHQWPEDMDAVLSGLHRGLGLSPKNRGSDVSAESVPLIQQWLELMPSPDWMCRSELILPKLKELLSDPRFEIRPVTLGEYLARVSSYVREGWDGHEPDSPVNLGRDAQATMPVRAYSMDQVWHGLTLGKNGDDMRRRSTRAEAKVQLAETLSAIAGVFGRPYPQWDVYPVWELEEAWRELLAAQHHDNDECEGLCGRVGKRQYERAEGLADDVIVNACRSIEKVAGAREFARLNPYGWHVPDRFGDRTVPPFSISDAWYHGGLSLDWRKGRTLVTQGRNDSHIEASIDLIQGVLTHLRRVGGPVWATADTPIAGLSIGEQIVARQLLKAKDVNRQYMEVSYEVADKRDVVLFDRSMPYHGIDIDLSGDGRPTPLASLISPGFGGALMMEVPVLCESPVIYADTAYGVYEVNHGSHGQRKYPEGDWMTSPQWFEGVEGAFTSLRLIDIVDAHTGEGLLIVHKGNQQWFLRNGSLKCVLAAMDPWDGSFFQENQWSSPEDGNCWMGSGQFRFIPHSKIDHAERWKIAAEFQQGTLVELNGPDFSFGSIAPHHVVVTALYREAEDFAGKHVENYAGKGMGYPYVLRLVELNGEPADVELTIVGPVARAYKTNLLGQIESEILPESSPPNAPPQVVRLEEGGFVYDTLRFHMRPHEIATLYLDIVPGRKQTRDLDAKREIWATVHRVD